jgi:hypothetical protein
VIGVSMLHSLKAAAFCSDGLGWCEIPMQVARVYKSSTSHPTHRMLRKTEALVVCVIQSGRTHRATRSRNGVNFYSCIGKREIN